MRWLLFLSRLAFICGICFLVSLIFLMRKTSGNEPVSSTIITIGFVLGILIVPFTLLSYLAVLVLGKKLPIPLWLIISNVIFMFVLMLYIIFINVKSDYTS